MTIDEAIKHCLEVAEQKERNSVELIDILDELDVDACKQCAADHRQLAEWLTELADLKEEIEYCSNDIHESIERSSEQSRKCSKAIDTSYLQGYTYGLREGEKYINRIKYKKEIQAELDKILNGNIVGIEIIDGLPE